MYLGYEHFLQEIFEEDKHYVNTKLKIKEQKLLAPKLKPYIVTERALIHCLTLVYLLLQQMIKT